jgi:ABC-2 type transport system permease protein
MITKISRKKLINKYRYSWILLKELVRTDFILRYQNSVLGYFWALLRPLFMFVVLYVIFVRFLHIGRDIPNWPVALFLGLVMWEFFAEVTKQGLKSIVKKGGIIRKINFPKYIIVVSSSLSALINLGLNLVVVGIFIVITDAPITSSIFIIPIYLLQLYLFAIGLAFFLGALYVKVRDIDFIWEVIMRAGFYASAVMFPLSRVGDAAQILLLNPVAQTITDARHNLVGNIEPSSTYFSSGLLSLVPFAVSLGFVIIGAIYFRRNSQSFAENV